MELLALNCCAFGGGDGACEEEVAPSCSNGELAPRRSCGCGGDSTLKAVIVVAGGGELPGGEPGESDGNGLSGLSVSRRSGSGHHRARSRLPEAAAPPECG